MMKMKITWLAVLAVGAVLVAEGEARRVRVQPRLPQEEAEESVQYYSSEPQQEVDDRQRVVLVSSDDQYNGLYGQQTASSRSSQEYSPRGAQRSQQLTAQRVKEAPKTPPVQTIRNYNKVNDDGSFTFGYEAADGSFKEETRGTDCVVRGKYGYVDPDGNKREFTYVSGNPCDPNAPKEEEDLPESVEEEAGPANYPTSPIRPIQRPAPRPVPVTTPAPKAVTLFQNNYEQEEDEQPEPEQILRPTPTPQYRPITRPQYVQAERATPLQYRTPQYVPSSTPASAQYRQSLPPVSVTPRPQLQSVSPTLATRAQLPVTTFKPQPLQVSINPRPSLLYTPKPLTVTSAPSKGIDFDAEFQRFQQENNLVSPTPSSYTKSAGSKSQLPAVGPIYNSALIYDAATGQYKNELYQALPQSQGDFTLNQRIQPYVHQTQRPALSLQPTPQPSASPLYRQQAPQVNPQALYQSQQNGLLFQNSAQLYAQQQKAREQQQQASSALKQDTKPAPVYYIQPTVDQTGALGASQIDAFLRGHNIQF
ncbi:uncharacterized protein LOC143201328 [Rhynchophorus ferrugineus]|uniref:Uncharacterized protein n=1 Tax=Rhynchophorus ferrugineus TaxID=354439 RepID=A0A834MB89_RHYFE|nr:hypothetical protein GWI33_015631 [Rhynchophorus ferrugineus]